MTLCRVTTACITGSILVSAHVRLFLFLALEKTWKEYYCICKENAFTLNLGSETDTEQGYILSLKTHLLCNLFC